MKLARWMALGAGALLSLAAAAQDVSLARLDCGSGSNDPRRFSDTFAYTETTQALHVQLLRHPAWCRRDGLGHGLPARARCPTPPTSRWPTC